MSPGNIKHYPYALYIRKSPGVSLGVAVGVGLGVGLGVSAALSGVFAAVGLVQFTVANAEEFINNPNVQPLGPWRTSESG